MTLALWTSRQRMIFAMVVASLTDAARSAAETNIHREQTNVIFANTAIPAGNKEIFMSKNTPANECNINPRVFTTHLHPCPRCEGRSVYQSKSTFQVGVPGSGRILDYRRCIECGNEFDMCERLPHEPQPKHCEENCPGNMGPVQDNIHEVDLWKEILKLRGENERLKAICKPLEGVSINHRPTGCICEPDTTRCPYDEAEEDRANRQAARELLNCGQYR